jgi:hypothetical protein
MQPPTFFIIGAPKCGTTALYTWLNAHPQICMSQPKEPQFFAEDIFGHQRNITNIGDYLRCFDNKTVVEEAGEASTCYLASPSAAEQIKTFSPNAKIVVMLRNPVEVMYSLHSERVFSHMETIRDFASAVDSTAERTWAAGRFRGQPVIRPSYREMVRFSDQIRRYMDLFSRNYIHVILLEDLLSSPVEAYKSTLDFLGLEFDQRDSFELVNDNRRARSLTLHRFARHPGKTIRHMGHFVLPRVVRAYISTTVNGFNTVRGPRPTLDAKLKRRLTREFEPHIQSLSVLLGRDLSSWCKD